MKNIHNDISKGVEVLIYRPLHHLQAPEGRRYNELEGFVFRQLRWDIEDTIKTAFKTIMEGQK